MRNNNPVTINWISLPIFELNTKVFFAQLSFVVYFIKTISISFNLEWKRSALSQRYAGRKNGLTFTLEGLSLFVWLIPLLPLILIMNIITCIVLISFYFGG